MNVARALRQPEDGEAAPGGAVEAPHSDLVVTCRGLRKVYREVVAVDGATFSVARGEIFGLLGPNGAGKTTTVECLQGLRRAEAGEVRVLGLDPQRQSAELRRRIGSQLQQSALPDHIKVWEALDLFASLTPGGRDWRVVMEEWGLGEKRAAPFHSLSGGQKQRLFVALALVNEPEVVFLDEMTTGLDPAARRDAWDLIRQMRDRGTTVVLVTHFMEEAERLCDRVAIVDRGRIVATGAPQALIAEHAQGVRVVFSTEVDDLAWLPAVAHVVSVNRHGPRVEVDGDGPVLAHVAAALLAHGIEPHDLHPEMPTLEDVFLHITGHSLRDEPELAQRVRRLSLG
jgi:ABC-2 type transport system ATP-binding protein